METAAVYTNIKYVYSASNNPIIRVSFMLYRDRAEDFFLATLYTGTGGDALDITVNTNTGTLEIENQDTGVRCVTQQYANVTCYYNMTNDDYALDYRGTNIWSWGHSSTKPFTQFVSLGFVTKCRSNEPDRATYVDNVRVDTFPASTLAWWRFDDETPGRLPDRCGYFEPGSYYNLSAGHVPSSCLPLYDGQSCRHDDFALRIPVVDNMYTGHTNVLAMDDWTLETIFRAQRDAPSFCIFEWGTGSGHNNTNTWIAWRWNSFETMAVNLYLRDGEQTVDHETWYPDLADLTMDDQWHHLAVVKTGAWINVYLDYRLSNTVPLDARTQGTYIFPPQAEARLGIALNGGSVANTNHIMDEFRITGRGLAPHEFLQYGRPGFTAQPVDFDASLWPWTFRAVPGQHCRIDQRTLMSDTMSWTNIMTRAATGNYTTVTIPRPAHDSLYLRMDADIHGWPRP
jgi:hypothetical protein